MLTLKSAREIEQMKESGQILAGIHVALRDFIQPGITTHQIDQFVQERIEKHGAVAAQIGYDGYQFATCTSCLLYTSPSPRDRTRSRMPSSA